MKIYFSPYTLQTPFDLSAVSQNRTREGALLKVEWDEGLIGYADLHPWPELGDWTVSEQMTGLREQRMTPQVKQSIWLAHRDALHRQAKTNILDKVPVIKNNFLVSDIVDNSVEILPQLVEKKFTHIKVKVGRDPLREIDFLYQVASAGLKIRLDFNGTGTWQTFEKFMAKIDVLKSSIEYVEDPFIYSESGWAEAQNIIKIALDNQSSRVQWRESEKPPFDILIIKPAKMDVDLAMKRCQQWNLNATVTSYMDHPVGMIHALAVAAELRQKHGPLMLDAGCMTHHLFSPDSFSSEISTQGSVVNRVAGIGIGFDHLLEAQPWQLIE